MNHSNVIVLNTCQVWLAKEVGRMRYEHNRSQGLTYHNYCESTTEDAEQNSFAAELAFARFVNVFPDLTFDRPGTYDCVTWKGKTVDVKCTTYDKGNLLVPDHKRQKRSDVYVLVVGHCPRFEIVGYATADTVFSYPLTNPGQGLCHIVPRGVLLRVPNFHYPDE